MRLVVDWKRYCKKILPSPKISPPAREFYLHIKSTRQKGHLSSNDYARLKLQLYTAFYFLFNLLQIAFEGFYTSRWS